ncbi:hypothetical protein QA644_14490 [Rhizobium sp. CC1099]|uniref:hypothetical protein n=1 Tax=Rhizobium sp. CC1099 TaxID=3039160 RepID=UPI0024B13216|nr:hypothetical protein [Rhizobium sp. CC1099]WFU86337.1 hypothetical protein QA644_14490 [Rhizobium sp. CC1099]
MSLFELHLFTDDEIELVTSAVGRWSERNHIDVKSEHGHATLIQAIAHVSSGMKSPEPSYASESSEMPLRRVGLANAIALSVLMLFA